MFHPLPPSQQLFLSWPVLKRWPSRHKIRLFLKERKKNGNCTQQSGPFFFLPKFFISTCTLTHTNRHPSFFCVCVWGECKATAKRNNWACVRVCTEWVHIHTVSAANSSTGENVPQPIPTLPTRPFLFGSGPPQVVCDVTTWPPQHRFTASRVYCFLGRNTLIFL